MIRANAEARDSACVGGALSFGLSSGLPVLLRSGFEFGFLAPAIGLSVNLVAAIIEFLSASRSWFRGWLSSRIPRLRVDICFDFVALFQIRMFRTWGEAIIEFLSTTRS